MARSPQEARQEIGLTRTQEYLALRYAVGKPWYVSNQSILDNLDQKNMSRVRELKEATFKKLTKHRDPFLLDYDPRFLDKYKRTKNLPLEED